MTSAEFRLIFMIVLQRLLKLKSDGTELVTNVQVAGDARENVHRVEEEENKRQRTKIAHIWYLVNGSLYIGLAN
jgi:hypothetical protein